MHTIFLTYMYVHVHEQVFLGIYIIFFYKHKHMYLPIDKHAQIHVYYELDRLDILDTIRSFRVCFLRIIHMFQWCILSLNVQNT